MCPITKFPISVRTGPSMGKKDLAGVDKQGLKWTFLGCLMGLVQCQERQKHKEMGKASTAWTEDRGKGRQKCISP